MSKDAQLVIDALHRIHRAHAEGIQPLRCLVLGATWLITTAAPKASPAALAAGVRIAVTRRNLFDGRPTDRLRQTLLAGLDAGRLVDSSRHAA